MADHRGQGFKVSTLWPDGPRKVERRSACDRRPTKSQDAHAQCALKSGPGIAIPGARPGPEHSVWAPLSSLSWSLTGVTAARAGRHHPHRARSRGPRQTRAKRMPCEARPGGGRRVAPSCPCPSTCSPSCVRPCLASFLPIFILVLGTQIFLIWTQNRNSRAGRTLLKRRCWRWSLWQRNGATCPLSSHSTGPSISPTAIRCNEKVNRNCMTN